MKTNELTGPALNWAVAKCEGRADVYYASTVKKMVWEGTYPMDDGESGAAIYQYCPSTDWAQGGPIIEREHIGLISPSNKLTMFWTADIGYESKFTQFDHDPLIAAMRCYVASKLGDEVDVPEELM